MQVEVHQRAELETWVWIMVQGRFLFKNNTTTTTTSTITTTITNSLVHRTGRFNAPFTMQFLVFIPISLGPTLILSSQLRLGLSKGLFPVLLLLIIKIVIYNLNLHSSRTGFCHHLLYHTEHSKSLDATYFCSCILLLVNEGRVEFHLLPKFALRWTSHYWSSSVLYFWFWSSCMAL